MADWKNRKDQDRKRKYQRRDSAIKSRELTTISAFRPLVPSPQLETSLLLFHTSLEEFLDQQGMGDSVERVALNALRLTLMPPRYLHAISKYNPSLTHAPKVKKHIRQALPLEKETIQDVPASRAWILREEEGNVVALVFHDQRLVDESVAAQEAIGIAYGSMRAPFVELSFIPALGRQATHDLKAQLSEAARQITVSFGPVDFD